MDDVRGIPSHEMQLVNFMLPITQAARRRFNTTTAAATGLEKRRRGLAIRGTGLGEEGR
jgi:hypothetical protein